MEISEFVVYKEELKRCLTLILNIVLGCGAVLPFWEDTIIQHQQSQVHTFDLI